MKNSAFFKFSVMAILFFMFLTPTIFVPGFIGIRLEEIYLLFFALVVLFVRNENGWCFKIPLRVVVLTIFLPLLMISTLMGELLSLPATLGDYSKIIWLIKAILLYLIFYNFTHSDGHERISRIDFVLQNFIRFATISAVICYQQYFDIFKLNSVYIPIVAPTQYVTLMPGYPTPRVVGMLGNPNVQGYVLTLAIVSIIYFILNKRKKISYLTLTVLFIALFMTLSRGALVALVVGSVYLFLMYKKPNTNLFITKTVVIVLLVIVFYIAYHLFLENETLYNAIFYRFELLENATEDISFVARYDGWRINWNYFKVSPFFGVGLLPRATDIFIGSDNEWLHFLRSFGIVGIFWLAIFLLTPILLTKNKPFEISNLNRFILSILVLSFTYMIPAAVILSPITFPFLLVFLSFSDRTVYVFKHRLISQKTHNIAFKLSTKGVVNE